MVDICDIIFCYFDFIKKEKNLLGLMGEGVVGIDWVQGNVSVNMVNISYSIVLNKASFKIIDKAFFSFRIVI